MVTNTRPLRCKAGLIKHFVIDGLGNISLADGSDFPIPTRISGRKKKYAQVQLMRSGTLRWYYVHRLVCFSWKGPSPHKLRNIVDHIDGNSLNNAVSNLRWVTIRGNNLNIKGKGVYEGNNRFMPKIAGFVHHRYASEDREVAELMRDQLVECYVRYNCRFPENGGDYPHHSIHIY